MFLLAMDDATRKWVEKTARVAYWDQFNQYSDTIFILVFIAAALLMLASCMLPRKGQSSSAIVRLAPMRGAFMQSGAVILLLLLAVSQQSRVDDSRGFVADQNKRYEAKIRELKKAGKDASILQAEYLYVPQGNALAYMSLGNTSLAADYMWLTSLQYVTSSFRRGQKFELLMRFYDNMVELDPHWTEAQTNAGRVLSALEPDRYVVEKFFVKAIEKNPDAWKLDFEAGRLFLIAPPSQKLRKEYAAHAAEWFTRMRDKIIALPNSKTDPLLQADIKQANVYISQMTLDSGQLEASDKMLWDLVTNQDNPKALRFSSAQEWVTARSLHQESLIQEQVNKMKADNGSFPANLQPVFDALKSNPIVAPIDAFGFPFSYNPTTGVVKSQGVLARIALQGHAVISSLLAGFIGTVGRPPNNMQEFQHFVTKSYAPPADPAPSGISAWIGEDLNVVTTPLGTPWHINSITGELEMPIGVDSQLVWRAIRKYFPDLMK